MALPAELGVEERRFIYTWFSNLLGRELSDEQLHNLQAGTFEPFFAFMSELGFEQQVANFQQILTACMVIQTHSRLELAADYAELFLLEGAVSALPYASAYLGDEELEQNLTKMDRYLERFKLSVNKQYNEPSDHLCVYLEVLNQLPENEQDTFIRQQLLPWLSLFADRVNKVGGRTAFYPVVVNWLVDVLT
ncbi:MULTISPECIES: molecular chaperone TorD [Glaesserella]|uniref:Molecular chaperone TorD n=1 Tax=Glaesserella australis TaxID=2094024 RepID=A0A328BVH7_9PAST|nr:MULTISPECIES: molecular chaperone TorD [Glaesserella]AUI66044.1 molecular chaperone TorD [Glaesserella sp. 15-184]RAL18236.1 molecular chaperone TorD [Glaesserella australis]